MKLIKRLKFWAEILLGITIILMLNVSLHEISTSNDAGIGFLIPITIYIAFMWLGWIKPLETGIALVLLGVTMFIFFRNIRGGQLSWFMMGGSTIFAGILLLGTGWKFREKTKSQIQSS